MELHTALDRRDVSWWVKQEHVTPTLDVNLRFVLCQVCMPRESLDRKGVCKVAAEQDRDAVTKALQKQ